MRAKNSIASDSILLMITKLITASIGVITAKLLAVNFSLSQYGTYSQLQLIYTTATSLLILGLTDATNYFYNSIKDEEEKKRYLSTIFTIQIIIGFIGAMVCIVCRQLFVVYFDNGELYRLIPIAAFIPMFMNLTAMFQVLFVSCGKAKIIALRNFAISTIMLIIISIACFVTKSVETIVCLELILYVVQVLIYYISLQRFGIKISFGFFRRQYCKPILNFSIPMALYIISNELARSIDKYIVGFYSSTEELAVYSVAARMLPFDIIVMSFITVIIPAITKNVANRNYEKACYIYKTYLQIGYMTTWPIVAGVIINAKEVMFFLYDEKYIIGLPIFIVYMFEIMIRFATVTFVLVAFKKTKLLMTYSFIGLGFNFVLSIIGYKMVGAIGPAIATLIVTILTSFCLMKSGMRLLRCEINDLFDFKEVFILVIQIGVASCITLFIRHIVEGYIHNNFVVLCLSYVIFIALTGACIYKKVFRYMKFDSLNDNSGDPL